MPMRLRDGGWLVFAGFWTLAAVFSLALMVGEVIHREWFAAATVPLVVLAEYWLAAGAWLRTERGQQDLGDPPPQPPALSAARARVFVALAAVCALACAVALGGQWIATR